MAAKHLFAWAVQRAIAYLAFPSRLTFDPTNSITSSHNTAKPSTKILESTTLGRLVSLSIPVSHSVLTSIPAPAQHLSISVNISLHVPLIVHFYFNLFLCFSPAQPPSHLFLSLKLRLCLYFCISLFLSLFLPLCLRLCEEEDDGRTTFYRNARRLDFECDVPLLSVKRATTTGAEPCQTDPSGTLVSGPCHRARNASLDARLLNSQSGTNRG